VCGRRAACGGLPERTVVGVLRLSLARHAWGGRGRRCGGPCRRRGHGTCTRTMRSCCRHRQQFHMARGCLRRRRMWSCCRHRQQLRIVAGTDLNSSTGPHTLHNLAARQRAPAAPRARWAGGRIGALAGGAAATGAVAARAGQGSRRAPAHRGRGGGGQPCADSCRPAGGRGMRRSGAGRRPAPTRAAGPAPGLPATQPVPSAGALPRDELRSTRANAALGAAAPAGGGRGRGAARGGRRRALAAAQRAVGEHPGVLRPATAVGGAGHS
jgi:hypothetical protein